MKRFSVAAAPVLPAILGVLLSSSCGAQPPTKPLPAYGLFITFPTTQGIVEVEKGGSITLAVAVISNSEVPIDVRLVLVSPVGQLPGFVQYKVPQTFTNIAPSQFLPMQLTFGVSNDALPGDYNIGITGDLLRPVKGRSAITQGFLLAIEN
jgi:hypothetical protein